MRLVRPCLSAALAVVVMTAVASPSLAADVCGETVPANRFIDGIPAYAQCAASMTAAIYSSDGINTATEAADSSWVRTQRSGGYQCTELANRYLRFRFNVTSVPNGDAGVWCNGALPSGLEKVTAPAHGDLIVLAPGSCGADATTGHVAVVDTVAADTLMAVQQNGASRGRYDITCAACFLHATANTGAPAPDAGAGDASRPDGGRDGGTGAAGAGGGGAGPGSGGAGAGSGGAGAGSGGAGSGGAGPGSDAGTGGRGGAIGTAGTMGAAGSTASGGAPSDPNDGASGGCVVAGTAASPVPSVLLLTAVGLLAMRRRRRD